MSDRRLTEGAVDLPRLFRPVPSSEMPTPRTLAVLLRTQNIVLINRDLWPTTPDHVKKEVYRTQSDEIVITY